MRPPESHVDLLERPVFAHLGTVRDDGSPLVNPMWFLWDPERGVIKLTHTTRRNNYRYVKRDPRVALSIADPDNQYRYLQVRGNVEQIEEDDGGRFYQVLSRRYRGEESDDPSRDHRVVLTVKPTGYLAH
jgi:PPOX class probable F420-dependent enzyme